MNNFTALRKNKTVIYLLIFIVALLFRLYNIEYRDVWMDEDAQSGVSGRGIFDMDMPQYSACYEQPPIDYLIQSAGIFNFGMSEIGLRIHIAVLGALSVLLFYIMMGKIIENRFVVILTSMIFAFHPWLIHYSRVGRPVGTGVFFAVLYLFVLFDFLVHARDRKTNTITFILLIIVQTWFLLSVGFQPLVFILTSSISLFPFLFNKKYFFKTALVYLSGLISFSFAYPILKLSIERGSEMYLEQASFLEHVLTVFKNLVSITFKAYIKYYKPLIDKYEILFFIGLILGIAGLIHVIISKKKNATTLLFLYFIIFTLAYPLIYASIFKALIKFYVTIRYYLSFTPVLIAGLGVGLYYGLSFLTHLMYNKYKLRLRYLPYGFILIIFLFSFYGNAQNLKEMYWVQYRDWEKVYELFKYHSSPGDTAYIINLAPPDKWVPTHFYTQKFYYKDETERHVRLKGKGSIVDDYQNIRSGKQRGNIYFVFLTGSEKLRESFFEKRVAPATHRRIGMNHGNEEKDKKIYGIKFYQFHRVCVAHLPNNEILSENILDFYYKLAKNLPKKEDNYIVYETLFKLEMAKGRFRKAKKHLNTLVRIQARGKLIEKIKELKKIWHQRKKKRKLIIGKRKNKKK
jgi:4-amino-4-deoxy-L-arabinose transferase-like glycosyltransferase